eukprot:GHVT01027948.1.p1 GENE.GHVT01027948.1~~GHVT01027948.1.p1  ORF type:complete len:175 (-),score=20.75 GHVT01027948.1:404-928(-)
MNGCSKRRSHRALHPVLDLYQSFAAIPRCIGRKLVNKVQKNLSSGNGGAGQACLAHPCVETWGRYRACLMATDLYRPSSGAGGSAASASGFAFSKCIPAATAHMRCVKLNKDWAPPEPADVTHTLERYWTWLQWRALLLCCHWVGETAGPRRVESGWVHLFSHFNFAVFLFFFI